MFLSQYNINYVRNKKINIQYAEKDLTEWFVSCIYQPVKQSTNYYVTKFTWR